MYVCLCISPTLLRHRSGIRPVLLRYSSEDHRSSTPTVAEEKHRDVRPDQAQGITSHRISLVLATPVALISSSLLTAGY